jgi:mRNA-degrading endonuclease RelE of RelBE toxin-antitoxin system
MDNPFDHKDMRALEGELEGFFRLRVGEYRILLKVDTIQRQISILSVLPRGQAY